MCGQARAAGAELHRMSLLFLVVRDRCLWSAAGFAHRILGARRFLPLPAHCRGVSSSTAAEQPGKRRAHHERSALSEAIVAMCTAAWSASRRRSSGISATKSARAHAAHADERRRPVAGRLETETGGGHGD